MSAPRAEGRTRLRVATGIWFGVLLIGLLATDAIARLDSRIIAVLVVIAATAMFTCMQIIVRETWSGPVPTRADPTCTQGKRVVDMIALNLLTVTSIYAILWSFGALPF